MDAIEFYKIKYSHRLFNFHQLMYSPKIIRDGIKFMDIQDANEIFDIIKASRENRIYLAQIADLKKQREEFINRFAIPRGLEKKEYKKILADTQTKIDDLKEKVRLMDPDDRIFVEMELDDYIDKKAKINKILELHEGYGELNIAKAKEYDIEQLIEFRGGFAKRCPNHSPDKDQDTPSLYHKNNTNFCYCFVCNQKFDSIDIFQKLNGVDFNTAVRSLSK